MGGIAHGATSRLVSVPGKKRRLCTSTHPYGKWDEIVYNKYRVCGPVAQLGERCVRNAEVVGSNPIGSTKESPS